MRGVFRFRTATFDLFIFVPAFAVGKEISFVSTHSLPNDEVTRDFGNAEIGGHDLATELLRNGWARLKDIKREPTEEDSRKRDLESEAKSAGKGIWNPHGPQVDFVLQVRIFPELIIGTKSTPHNASGLASFCVRMERKITRR